MSLNASSEQSADGVAAVERALTIVSTISQQTEAISLADLSRATGFYKSTLLRLIASLEKSALVIRRADGRYALGPFAHHLGRAYEDTYRLQETILPVLRALVAAGTESASFHVYHDANTRMCLLRVDSNHPTLDRIRVGDLLPLAKGAAGRLLTAYLVKRQSVAETGLALTSMGERDPSCAAVASPVFGPGGEMCGAISVSGPKERFTPTTVKTMAGQVREAAQQATIGMGGRWPH